VTLNISQSTCYRILQTYVAAGWLRPRESGTFELSFGLVPLLRPLLRHEVLIEAVRDPLAQLAKTTGMTAKLTVRQGDDAVTIYSAQSPRPHAIASRVGAIVSLAIGSSGASYLGDLPDEEVARILNAAPAEAWKFQKPEAVMKRIREGRKLGYYSDNGSYQPNIHTLSAPLYSQDHESVGAISLLGFPQDFAGTAKAALIKELKYTVGGCNQLIHGPSSGAT
jgi:DNA-binding IclR family transcriptional regulator